MKWPLRNCGATYLRDVTGTVQTVQYSDSQCTLCTVIILARASTLQLVACRAILYSTTTFYTVRVLFWHNIHTYMTDSQSHILLLFRIIKSARFPSYPVAMAITLCDRPEIQNTKVIIINHSRLFSHKIFCFCVLGYIISIWQAITDTGWSGGDKFINDHLEGQEEDW